MDLRSERHGRCKCQRFVKSTYNNNTRAKEDVLKIPFVGVFNYSYKAREEKDVCRSSGSARRKVAEAEGGSKMSETFK